MSNKNVMLNEVVSSVLRRNLQEEFGKPELMKDEGFVKKVEAEVKRKLSTDCRNNSFTENKDMLVEVVEEITFNVLKHRYHLVADETRKRVKLHALQGGIFSNDNLRSSGLPSPTGVKTL